MFGLRFSSLPVICITLLYVYRVTEAGEEGREFAASARAFKEKHKKYLNLGDCVARGGKTVPNLKLVGSRVFVDNARTDLQFHQLKTNLDSLTRTMAGVSAGIDFLGLIGGSVETTVTVTVKTKRNTVTMEAQLQVSRGVDTLRDARPNPAKPVQEFKNNCPYYVSEIVYGGEERMIVNMEFETKEKKTDIEVKITIKILFFKISFKLRFIFTDNSAKGKVMILRIRNDGSEAEESFSMSDAGEKTRAYGLVELAERDMARLPASLRSKSNSQLHQMYFFAKTVIDKSYTPGLLSNLWAYQRVKTQAYELTSTLSDIDDDLKTRTMPTGIIGQLKIVRSVVSGKKTRMDRLLSSYTGSTSELGVLLAEYGTNRAPGYYRRKHKAVLPDEQYLVCANKGIPTNGLANARGLTLKECGQNCNQDSRCTAYAFKANGGWCYLYKSATCPRVSAQSGTTFVRTERAKCGNLGGCVSKAFVE